MADIFLSYAEEDRPKARVLADRLAERGWTVFWDRAIRSGETWREVIARELGAARAVVVAWSTASIGSTWVQEEADEARQRNILVPVLIEAVSPPIGFRSVQTADLSGWEGGSATVPAGFDRLVADLGVLLGEAGTAVDASGESSSQPAGEARWAGLAGRTGPLARRWLARLAGAFVGLVLGFLLGGSAGELLVGGSAERFAYLIFTSTVLGAAIGLWAVYRWQWRRAGRRSE